MLCTTAIQRKSFTETLNLRICYWEQMVNWRLQILGGLSTLHPRGILFIPAIMAHAGKMHLASVRGTQPRNSCWFNALHVEAETPLNVWLHSFGVFLTGGLRYAARLTIFLQRWLRAKPTMRKWTSGAWVFSVMSFWSGILLLRRRAMKKRTVKSLG